MISNSDKPTLIDLPQITYDLCTNTVFTKMQNGSNLRQLPNKLRLRRENVIQI